MHICAVHLYFCATWTSSMKVVASIFLHLKLLCTQLRRVTTTLSSKLPLTCTLLVTFFAQEIEQFSRTEADQAVEQLESLRLLTTGTNNVTWATITDMTTNVVNLGGVLNIAGGGNDSGVGSSGASGVGGANHEHVGDGSSDQENLYSIGSRNSSSSLLRNSGTRNVLLDSRVDSDDKL